MTTAGRYAIGYIRVSTAEQAEEGVSLDAQREKIGQYCNLHGMLLSETCADEGISGKRADNRPGLTRALDEVCRSKGVLVVYSLSRLARSTRDCITISERVEKCGADMASITEKIDTTSGMGRFFFRLMASLGELERDQISERTRAALQHKRLKGERIGKVPYGYDLDPDGIRLVPKPPEQIMLGAIVGLKRGGASSHRIAAYLNAACVPAKNGGAWQPCSVRRILQREMSRA
jgi:site-specific DNA recombinase